MANPFITQAGPMQAVASSPELAPQMMGLQRKQKLAELLQQQALQQDQGQMISGHYVRPSMIGGLAKIAGAYLSGKMQNDIAEKQAELLRQQQQGVSDWLSAMPKDKPAGLQAEQLPPEVFGPPQVTETPAKPVTKEQKLAWLLRGAQVAPQIAGPMLQTELDDKPIVVGKSLLTKRGEVIGTDATWADEQKMSREDKAKLAAESLQARKDMAQQQMDLRRDLAAQSSADRRMIAGMVNARQEQKNVPKLPTSALKMQQEDLEAIGTSSAINSDLKALSDQIDTGKLNLGPVNNVLAKAKNMAGLSDEQSRNYASFNSTLEKLRNDSLRLNKGVQTEGDAQRAWNELIANANDPKVVKQRLGEIQKINERAVNLRKMNVDAIRTNFGVEPMDTTGYSNVQPAVGQQGGGGFKIIGVK